jgi:hypothetical protein
MIVSVPIEMLTVVLQLAVEHARHRLKKASFHPSRLTHSSRVNCLSIAAVPLRQPLWQHLLPSVEALTLVMTTRMIRVREPAGSSLRLGTTKSLCKSHFWCSGGQRTASFAGFSASTRSVGCSAGNSSSGLKTTALFALGVSKGVTSGALHRFNLEQHALLANHLDLSAGR